VMEELAAAVPEVGLRLKQSWDRVTILGPRQLITGQRVRVAGVPVKAARLADGRLHGEVWESLPKAVRERRTGEVRITQRAWKVRGKDSRRDPGPDGWTVPRRVGAPV